MIVLWEEYLFKSDDMDTVAAELGRLLNLTVTTRHSEIRGGTFKSLDDDAGTDFVLIYNFHPIDRDWNVPNFQEYRLLLEGVQPGGEPKIGPMIEETMAKFGPLLLLRMRFDDAFEGEEIEEHSEVLFDREGRRSGA